MAAKEPFSPTYVNRWGHDDFADLIGRLPIVISAARKQAA